VEHYAGCPVIRLLGMQFLQVRIPPGAGLEYFTLVHRDLTDSELLIKVTLMIYAAYRVTERLRRTMDQAVQADFQDMLQQAVREGARGHRKVIRIVDGSRPR